MHRLADQAPECGGAYYRYGAALFYKAQDEADVFGDNLQDAAEKHDAQVGAGVKDFCIVVAQQQRNRKRAASAALDTALQRPEWRSI